MKFPRLAALRLPSVTTQDFRSSMADWFGELPIVVKMNDTFRAVILSPEQFEDILDKIAGSEEQEVVLADQNDEASPEDDTPTDDSSSATEERVADNPPPPAANPPCEKVLINANSPCYAPAYHRVQIATRTEEGIYRYPEVSLCQDHYNRLKEANIGFDTDEAL